ncbi:hypothetical protein GN330_18065 [Nitratireductor sp. CAU 1489]|uniref:Zinc transport system substrate-binding protein n=1 Tax=Nitratireductor arenosus TaxID=2682096 RepID=A0A844QM88_9HYPH|nr:metallochaperone AztD [Nitratireductor arenosus]MVA99158.1 hypothetical protein [Nitratireductor arenosus]
MTVRFHRPMILACAIALSGYPACAEQIEAWRVFVADHSEPVVRAFDLREGKEVDRFALAGAARLHRSQSGRVVYAVQRDANRVQMIGTGIALGDHGDHGDITIEAPALLDAILAGRKPVHLVERDGTVAAFFDDEGIARLVSEHAALEGTEEPRDIASSAPHHGVAIPFGVHLLVTRPHPSDPGALPVGLDLFGPDGAPTGDHAPCPDLHGEAQSGNLVAVACATGLLVVAPGPERPDIRHLPYATGLPEGKTTKLVGGKGLRYFLGNFAARTLVLIDPTQAEESFRPVELPTRVVDFATHPAKPRFALAFTEDGYLHRIDVIAGQIDRSVRLTAPYSMDGHWSDPRPRIAVAGPLIVVSDPLAGHLHVVDTETFEPTGAIAVEGEPFSLVAVGGAGETH